MWLFLQQWRCKTGDCIDLDNVCDGIYDCDDKDDEQDKMCNEKIDVRLSDGIPSR